MFYRFKGSLALVFSLRVAGKSFPEIVVDEPSELCVWDGVRENVDEALILAISSSWFLLEIPGPSV